MSKELRYGKLDNVEFRNEDMKISGYAITFNSKSGNLGGFEEIISERALENVDLSNVYFLRNHNEDFVLGSTKNGTLNLEVTKRGLYFELELPKTVRGEEIYTLVKRGDLDSLSFGFTVAKDVWNMEVSPEIRKIEKIGRLFEISLVNFPAYEDSKVSERSLDFLNECRECRKESNVEIDGLAKEAMEILNKIKNK